MKFLKPFIALISITIALGITPEKPYPGLKCCETCSNGKEKYYSVDKKYDKCGECCMKPNLYWLYNIFEPGLTKADVNHPCQELGYSEHEITEKHGFLFISIILDKYKKQDQIKRSKFIEKEL